MVNLFESSFTCVPICLFFTGSQLKLHRLFCRLLQRGSSHDSVVRCHLLRKCSGIIMNASPQASLFRFIPAVSCPLPRLSWSSPHPISNSQLHVLPHFHLCPIYLVVFKGVYFFRMGHLILRGASRLDAFSVYPFRTWLPGRRLGSLTGTPAVRPSRSSRTKDSSSQISYAHAG